MQAEIITIGDEILIGQVADTNSAWLAALLNENGIKVHQITSVSDNSAHIIEALNESAKRADVILLTGGLGPTRDDITKKTLCTYFGAGLRFDAEVMKDVENRLKQFNRHVTELNKNQAEIPENCIALRNKSGTAPGMWFEQDGKVYVSLPGVPYEMKGLMLDEVMPRLKQKFRMPAIVNKTVLTIGIAESVLAEKISAWEDSLASDRLSLAYLPSPGMVRLRLSGSGSDRSALEQIIGRKVKELQKLAGDYIYGYDNDTLEHIIGKILTESGKSLSAAESCTGGYLAHLITSVAGSSVYFKGSVVTYAIETKVNILGVKAEAIAKYGVVSAETAEEMAHEVRARLNTDYSIATTGVAGPGGGTAENPVGTVWIAVAAKDKIISQKFLFPYNRERNIHVASLTAMNMLRRKLSMQNP